MFLVCFPNVDEQANANAYFFPNKSWHGKDAFNFDRDIRGNRGPTNAVLKLLFF